MAQVEEYHQNKNLLTKWLETNIISYGGELFNTLMNKEVITYEDIENYYEEINESDYKTMEEYKNALDNQEPQQVMQWYMVTEEGYNKFKKVGYPVVKINELHFYGRTAYGQAIYLDFYYTPEKIKMILSNE